MNKMSYFEKEDIIHIQLSDEEEWSSYEISPNITVELNKNKEIIGIEILQASSYLRDNLLESVQAKLFSAG